MDNAVERCAMQRELQQQLHALSERARRDSFFLEFSAARRSSSDSDADKVEAAGRLGC